MVWIILLHWFLRQQLLQHNFKWICFSIKWPAHTSPNHHMHHNHHHNHHHHQVFRHGWLLLFKWRQSNPAFRLNWTRNHADTITTIITPSSSSSPLYCQAANSDGHNKEKSSTLGSLLNLHWIFVKVLFSVCFVSFNPLVTVGWNIGWCHISC